jgi:signal transduction histidine kinase
VERLREERQKALLRGIPFENEQRARRKDGQYRWFFIRYNALPDEQGNPVRWYAAGIDIEDRKRAEERVRNENLALREEIDRTSMFEEIVGSSDALRTVLTQVSRVAPTDTTVLILGETGTGKELIARAIHKRSGRSARAFIRVNCLTNIHRHSGGASAQVRLLRLPGEVKLEVVDDGRGINEETLSDIASGTTAGVGLRGMRERVRQLGGNVEVRSNGKGTTVIARLPFIESPTDRDEPVSDPADNRVPARM